MTRRDILKTKGKVTHKQALEKAHMEYQKFKHNRDYILSSVEKHFLKSIEQLDEID